MNLRRFLDCVLLDFGPREKNKHKTNLAFFLQNKNKRLHEFFKNEGEYRLPKKHRVFSLYVQAYNARYTRPELHSVEKPGHQG